MAVPHLDTRVLDGKKTLLFGPFAAWTTKFLHKKGSVLDLPLSVKPDNLFTLVNIGIHNLDLVRYLVQQGTQSMKDRMDVLRVFYPAAQGRGLEADRRRHPRAGDQEDRRQGRHRPLRHGVITNEGPQHLRAARRIARRFRRRRPP